MKKNLKAFTEPVPPPQLVLAGCSVCAQDNRET